MHKAAASNFERHYLGFTGKTDPSAGHDEQGAAAVVAAQEPLKGDA